MPRAFTLIELVVAVGLTAFIAAGMVVVVNSVSGFWSRTAGRGAAEAQARYLLDQLTQDLQSALYRDDGKTWLAATVLTNTNNATPLWNTATTTPAALKPATATGTTLTYGAANLTDATFGQAGTWLRFFTTKRGSNTTNANASAPVAVGWQIIRRASTASAANTDRRYFLHRAEARTTQQGSSIGTFEAGFDITAAPYTTNQTNNTGQLGDPRSVRVPQSVDTIVAENVIDFGVRLYVYDATATSGLTRIFPFTNNDLTHTATRPPGVANAAGNLDNCFPDVADVMVRVLTDEGARLIAAYEASPQRVTAPAGRNPQQFWWELALANSRVFTRRVALNGKSL